MSQPIACQVIINSVRTRQDNSLGLSIETPELTNEAMLVFLRLRGMNLNMILTPLADTQEVVPLEVKTEVSQRTPSQRIRACLFVLFKSRIDSGKLASDTLFEVFYAQKCEQIINWIKLKLPEL